MRPFEVTITMPGAEPALQMRLDANHWMEAWKVAMSELGIDDFDESQVTCKIRPDGAVEVVMPDLLGRRFLVASAPRVERTTSDRPATIVKASKRQCITIEEMAPVKADDTVPELSAAHQSNRTATGRHHVYARVSRLDGGLETNLREAIGMLAGHVPAQHVLFLLPSVNRESWEIALSRGARDGALEHTRLAGSSPVPGPVDAIAGRRHFAEPVTLTFAPSQGPATLVTVNSALWAPVRVDGTCYGVFLALNTARPTGFDGGEFDATQKLAALVAARL